jgi:MFS family permease
MDRTLRTLPEPTVTGSPREGRGRATAALISVCLGFFVIQLDVTIVNLALPAIQREIGGSLAGVQWVVDAYTLALASIMLTAGSTADRVGPRRCSPSGSPRSP